MEWIYIGSIIDLNLPEYYSIPMLGQKQKKDQVLNMVQRISKIEETNRHSIKDILEEGLEHELYALSLYKKLLDSVENASIYLEEYARGMIGEEEQHSLELKAMLKDFG